MLIVDEEGDRPVHEGVAEGDQGGAEEQGDDTPPEQRGIFIAGDDVSWTPAWVEGAVQTSLNAVWGIMHHLGGSTHPDNQGPGDVFADIAPIELPD